jgi:hypothetical protein
VDYVRLQVVRYIDLDQCLLTEPEIELDCLMVMQYKPGFCKTGLLRVEAELGPAGWATSPWRQEWWLLRHEAEGRGLRRENNWSA